jgi:hypothetical protein
LSAADVVLAAIAARTARIRVGSAVTVLSSADPVRVFQRYSTLDAGRACGPGANRFDLMYGMEGLSHQALMTNIELYATQVIPRVRELLAS